MFERASNKMVDGDDKASAAVIKVKRVRDGAKLPMKATAGSTGYDLFACIEGEEYVNLTKQPRLVGTGIAIEVPPGFDAQIRPRSGLSLRGVLATFGTIDCDYRGEVFVTMHLCDPLESYQINHGDRIAQLVISRLPESNIVEVEDLAATERGTGGHGSTGK